MRFCFQGDPEAVPEWNACQVFSHGKGGCLLHSVLEWLMNMNNQWQRRKGAIDVIHFPSTISPLQYIGSLPRRKKQGQYYTFHLAMDTARQHDWLLDWYETNAGNEHTSSCSQLIKIKFKSCDLSSHLFISDLCQPTFQEALEIKT